MPGAAKNKAQGLVNSIPAANNVEIAVLDINFGFKDQLKEIAPDIVIHTSGPFQSQGYDIAQACIEQSCHYIDLADGREFVSNIISLNNKATLNKVTVVSGASSVPCLTSALLDNYQTQFEEIHYVDYGITTAQKNSKRLGNHRCYFGLYRKVIYDSQRW